MRYNSQGLKLEVALQITGISKHQYYYKPKNTSQGRKASLFTKNISGAIVSNLEIVDAIIHLQEDPDTIYGYKKTTTALKMDGFIINRKKTYRLMKKHHLLQEKVKRSQKTYAKYRKLLPDGPLRLLEMDIKMTWVESVQKHAYTLTLIDTYTRVVLHRITQYSIKKNDVKLFWDYVIEHYLQERDCLNKKIDIEIRNDNDKRFSALMIKDYFKENHLDQVFTHPYTPQENAHIESFHNILGKHLNSRLFWDIEELENDLKLFYDKYNNKRLHTSIADLPPKIFWDLHDKNLIQKTVDEKNRKIKFKLKIPYYQVKKHTGKIEPEGSSLPSYKNVRMSKKRGGAEFLLQHTV